MARTPSSQAKIMQRSLGLKQGVGLGNTSRPQQFCMLQTQALSLVSVPSGVPHSASVPHGGWKPSGRLKTTQPFPLGPLQREAHSYCWQALFALVWRLRGLGEGDSFFSLFSCFPQGSPILHLPASLPQDSFRKKSQGWNYLPDNSFLLATATRKGRKPGATA